jgi:hypothetical protein
MESRSANFGAKLVPSLNGADLSFMNSVTGSVCRAKCSNIIQDKKISSKLLISGQTYKTLYGRKLGLFIIS